MINVAEIVTDPDLAQVFTVKRESGGEFGEGGWIPGTTTEIPMTGPVILSSPDELEQLPAGDRVKSANAFYATVPIYRTRDGALSDIITWQGEDFKVLQVYDRSSYGYYKAVAVRLSGD